MRHFLGMFTAALALAACETTNVGSIDPGARPDESTDEAGLWLRMSRAEQQLRLSAVVVRDKELNDYVRDVTCRVTGPEYCNDLRIYVVEAPYFNATMAPNGMMQVWTGLLLRAENEAQLAFVLGHEFVHYRERHSLAQFRSFKNLSGANMAVAMVAGAAGVPEAAMLGSAVFTARLYGYGRDDEREADEGGFKAAVTGGYEGNEAPRLWETVIAEVEASSSERKRRRFARASIWSTHPLSTERVENLQTLAKDVGRPGEVGADRHRAIIAPYLNDWLDLDLTRRDLGEHFYVLEKLQAAERDKGVLLFRLGEAYRVRRDEGDFARAAKAYKAASEFDDAPAATWRELGGIMRRDGNTAAAVDAYKTYLEKAPESPDRAFIQRFLDQYPSATAGSAPAATAEEETPS